jgi:hypothetical protein
MGGYFYDSGLLWDLPASRPIKDDDLASHVARVGEISRVQICHESSGKRLDGSMLRALRDRVFAVRPDLRLRVYGSTQLDLSFLEEIATVRDLQIEVRERLHNVAALGALRDLRVLHLTLPKALPDDILGHLPSGVEELSLVPDDGKPATIDLDPIGALKKLKALDLGLGFHKKDDVKQMNELLAKHRIDGEVYMYPQLRGDYDELAQS